MKEISSIAFLCHPYHRGGVTRWMADAAIAFANKGLEVYFVTVTPVQPFISAKTAETMVQLLQKTTNKVKQISTSVGREFEFGTPEYRTYIYKHLLVNNVPAGIPVVLSDDPPVWGASSLNNTYPFVGVLHSDEAQYYELAKKYNKQVAIFPCVSERVNKTVKQQCPEIAADRVSTIPCGIDLPAIKAHAPNSGVLKMVYVGRLTEYQKRISDLFNIAKKLVDDNVAFTFTIVGDGGTDKEKLQKKVGDAGMQKQVNFTGWQTKSQVQDHLNQSDVLILTSDFEGTPISMMEGLAAGCGFVGTRVSGIEDYELKATATDCFRIYNTGETDDAVKKIKEIAAIPEEIRQDAARQLAETEFSMDICLDRYMNAIATIKEKAYTTGKVSISSKELIKSRVLSILRDIKVSMKK